MHLVFNLFGVDDVFRVPFGDPDDPDISVTIELCTADGIPLVTSDGNYIGVTG